MNKLKRPLSYTLLILVSLVFLGLTLYFLQAPAPTTAMVGDLPEVKLPSFKPTADFLLGLF